MHRNLINFFAICFLRDKSQLVSQGRRQRGWGPGFCAPKRKRNKGKKESSFKAETIKRLSPRSNC